MTTRQTSCPSFAELADYWASETTPLDIERIEAHVFECDHCARVLAETDQLRSAIGDLARADEILNRVDVAHGVGLRRVVRRVAGGNTGSPARIP